MESCSERIKRLSKPLVRETDNLYQEELENVLAKIYGDYRTKEIIRNMEVSGEYGKH